MSKQSPNPRRAELRERSAALQMMVKAGMIDSVNEGLIMEYSRETGAAEWHTFKDWKAAGKCVRKGEQGFPIWGRPRATKPADGATGSDLATLGALIGADPQGPQFFPVCYLFHSGQVETTTSATESGTIPVTWKGDNFQMPESELDVIPHHFSTMAGSL